MVWKRKRKPGAQPGNVNAVKHGAYSERLAPDSPQGHLVRWIEARLSSSFPDPTPQQILILKRAAVKAFRCERFEREILRNGGGTESQRNEYLRWAQSLRDDLRLLGLERKARDVIDVTAELEPFRAARGRERDE